LPAEIKQTEALDHFDSSWGKHTAISLCLFGRMSSKEAGLSREKSKPCG